MPLLTQMHSARTASAISTVRRLAALSGTLAFQRKRDRSLRILAEWRRQCLRPVVACGGGKDSTALLLLALEVDATMPIYRADPPNALSDRPTHVDLLQRATPSPWVIVPYPWDVAGVLAGDRPYPAMLKVRTMEARLASDGIDGVALGLRRQESRAREIHYRLRGAIYRKANGWLMCQPIADWTADEVIGYTIASDRLPLNPVYTKTYLQPDLNRLRDGTWYPREVSDALGYRGWLRFHYPEHAEDYDRATVAAIRTAPTTARKAAGE